MTKFPRLTKAQKEIFRLINEEYWTLISTDDRHGNRGDRYHLASPATRYREAGSERKRVHPGTAVALMEENLICVWDSAKDPETGIITSRYGETQEVCEFLKPVTP